MFTFRLVIPDGIRSNLQNHHLKNKLKPRNSVDSTIVTTIILISPVIYMTIIEKLIRERKLEQFVWAPQDGGADLSNPNQGQGQARPEEPMRTGGRLVTNTKWWSSSGRSELEGN